MLYETGKGENYLRQPNPNQPSQYRQQKKAISPTSLTGFRIKSIAHAATWSPFYNYL